MNVDFPSGRSLELWVVDTGNLDSVGVFVNGVIASFFADKSRHVFPLDRPVSHSAVVIHFGGSDGGASAVVDVTGGQELFLANLTPADGMRHSYILKAV